MIGTIVNVTTIVVGSTIGNVFKKDERNLSGHPDAGDGFGRHGTRCEFDREVYAG